MRVSKKIFIIINLILLTASAKASREPTSVLSDLAEKELTSKTKEIRSPQQQPSTSPATIKIPKIEFKKPVGLNAKRWSVGFQNFKANNSEFVIQTSKETISKIEGSGYPYIHIEQPVYSNNYFTRVLKILGGVGYARNAIELVNPESLKTSKSYLQLYVLELGGLVEQKITSNVSVELKLVKDFYIYTVSSTNGSYQESFKDESLNYGLGVNWNFSDKYSLLVNYGRLMSSNNLSVQPESGFSVALKGYL